MLYFKKKNRPNVLKNIYSLKHSMRGYNYLVKSNSLGKIHEIRNKLSKQKLSNNLNFNSKFLFGNLNFDLEISVRQYLLQRLVDIKLNKILLSFFGKKKSNQIIILPPEWRLILKTYGYNVDSILNKFLWFLYVLFLFAYGVYENIKKSILILSNILNPKKRELIKNSAFFIDLSSNNLPNQNVNEKNIINWYHKNFGLKNDIKFYYHNVRNSDSKKIEDITIIKNNYKIPLPNHLYNYIKFNLWFLLSFFKVLVELCKMNFAPAILYHELSLNYVISIQNKSLPKSFLFSQIRYLYKPLWAYTIESLGNEAILYFYASNINAIHLKENEDYKLSNFWDLITWKKYFVWDNYMINFLKKNNQSASKFFNCGPIYFSDSQTKININFKKYITVFDTQPMRSSFYHLLIEYPFHIAEVVNKFNNDIYKISVLFNFNIVHKRKRNNEIYDLHHKGYIKNLDKLNRKNTFFSAPPSLSPYRLIESSFLTIGMPYSSLPLYSHLNNKNSIYYDPTSTVKFDEEKSHGIELISGFESLKSWFNKFYFKSDTSKYL